MPHHHNNTNFTHCGHRRRGSIAFVSPFGISSSVVCAASAVVAHEHNMSLQRLSSGGNRPADCRHLAVGAENNVAGGRTETHQLLGVLSSLSALEVSIESHMLGRWLPQIHFDVNELLGELVTFRNALPLCEIGRSA
jgi:hypothetical protein